MNLNRFTVLAGSPDMARETPQATAPYGSQRSTWPSRHDFDLARATSTPEEDPSLVTADVFDDCV
jgi:hypothetical protein